MNKELQEYINKANNIVFFGGAGTSTESGIPDFRSADGIYSKQKTIPPEIILSLSFFEKNTSEFYDFYKNNMIFLDAEPNAAHKSLAQLEKEGKLACVITQNIDGLHQKAGSKTVLELHGSIYRNFCTLCKESFGLATILEAEGVPYCNCGGIIKPDVVLYEEPLNQDTINQAIDFLQKADLLIVGGTSLNVYPAAGLIGHFGGRDSVVINLSPTYFDSKASLLIKEPIAKAFSQEHIKK